MSVTKGGHSQLGWTSLYIHGGELRSCRPQLIFYSLCQDVNRGQLKPPHQAVGRHKSDYEQSDSLAKGLARKSCQQRLMFHLALTTLRMRHDRQPECGGTHLESIWELRQED